MGKKKFGSSSKPVLLGKFEYNSPVILTYALVCVVFFVINAITVGKFNSALLTTQPHMGFSLRSILRSVMYIFGHSSMSHLTGNMMLFLLVGPIVEERYGSANLILMIFSTALITSIVNGILPGGSGIIGASGIVFMLIILSAFTSSSGDKIPLSLVLVFLIYVGNEVVTGIIKPTDNVSQFGHIAGGICGLIWGFIMQVTGSVKKN